MPDTLFYDFITLRSDLLRRGSKAALQEVGVLPTVAAWCMCSTVPMIFVPDFRAHDTQVWIFVMVSMHVIACPSIYLHITELLSSMHCTSATKYALYAMETNGVFSYQYKGSQLLGSSIAGTYFLWMSAALTLKQ